MTKLCPRGKAAAKRKFKVYPSAYANAYASKICAGKIKDPSGVKRKDFRGSKAKGGRIGYSDGTPRIMNKPRTRGPVAGPGSAPPAMTKEKLKKEFNSRTNKKRQPKKNTPRGGSSMDPIPTDKRKKMFKRDGMEFDKPLGPKGTFNTSNPPKRYEVAGGGLMEATARLKRQGLGMGGRVCKIAKRGMNRDAIGKNS